MTFVYKSIGWTEEERLRQSKSALNDHISIFNSARQFFIINRFKMGEEIYGK